MKKIQVAKTILAVVPHIDKYCESIAKANRARALSSYSSTLQDTQQLMERIIDKTYRAQQLHNLKVKVSKKLETAPEKFQEVIQGIYFNNDKPLHIAKRIGQSERTVFRIINQAIEWFAGGLDDIGMDYLSFRRLVAMYPWIRGEFENQLKT